MMLADSIARDARETGVEREGTYSGIWLATEKIGFAFGALTVGLLLGLFGFKESTGGLEADQSHTAVIGIALIYAGINVGVYLLSIVPVLRYQRLARA
jgi:Na+/melibiose symporter-like transporter